MLEISCKQNSPEWERARLGIPTASAFNRIITTKGELSAQREKYMYGLIEERITGISSDGFANYHTRRGHEFEPEAIAFFQLTTGIKVDKVGFCMLDDKSAGASPDGLVEGDEGLEVKCKTLVVHAKYMEDNKLPTEFIQQVQGSLWVTGRERWHFLSYYPQLKGLHIVVERDEIFIAKMSKAIKIFNEELNETYNRLKGE